MREILVFALLLLPIGNLRAAKESQPETQKDNLALFLHDLKRDSARWQSLANEVDSTTLKDLPYMKGHVMDVAKGQCLKDISKLQEDIGEISQNAGIAVQVQLLSDLEDLQGSTIELGSDLDVENPSDVDKLSAWENDNLTMLSEVEKTTSEFYAHLLTICLSVDKHVDTDSLTRTEWNSAHTP